MDDDITRKAIDALHKAGMLSKGPWDKASPSENCYHSDAASCKQARLLADHKARCGEQCKCFQPNRGFQEQLARWGFKKIDTNGRIIESKEQS